MPDTITDMTVSMENAEAPAPEAPKSASSNIDIQAMTDSEGPVLTPESESEFPEMADAETPLEDISEDISPDEDFDLPPGLTRERLKTLLNQRHAREIAEDMRLRRHFTRLHQQVDALKDQYPDFDLSREMANPLFARLTAPEVAIDPATAYEIIHRQSLEKARQETRQRQLSQIALSSALRPRENALTGVHAAAPMKTDPRHLSESDRQAIRQRVARGERIVL